MIRQILHGMVSLVENSRFRLPFLHEMCGLVENLGLERKMSTGCGPGGHYICVDVSCKCLEEFLLADCGNEFL